MNVNDNPPSDNQKPPTNQGMEDHMNANDEEPTASNFMPYFFVITLLTICAYLLFHNKKKVSKYQSFLRRK